MAHWFPQRLKKIREWEKRIDHYQRLYSRGELTFAEMNHLIYRARASIQKMKANNTKEVILNGRLKKQQR